MACKISLLDCTLRDGAYIVDSNFGEEEIKSIISYIEKSGAEIIECGWLKNDEHKDGSSFYHVPTDLNKYVVKKEKIKYVLMLDWNRYDTKYLLYNDEKICDSIRVTFPIDKIKEGMEIGKKIQDKGYDVSFQLVNAKSYCKDDKDTIAFLYKFIDDINDMKVKHIGLSDTFGSMYPEDVRYIAKVFNSLLDKNTSLGLHTHNNMLLAFSNTITFLDQLKDSERDLFVDSSIYGMGRGAGNTPTELLMNYLNKHYDKKYDTKYIFDCIDKYIFAYSDKYKWGYDAYNGLAGANACHINNLSYLIKNYKLPLSLVKKVFESMDDKKRNKYDYDYIDSIVKGLDDER